MQDDPYSCIITNEIVRYQRAAQMKYKHYLMEKRKQVEKSEKQMKTEKLKEDMCEEKKKEPQAGSCCTATT